MAYDQFAALPRPPLLQFDWALPQKVLFAWMAGAIGIVMASNSIAIVKLGKRDSIPADYARVLGIWAILSPVIVFAFCEVICAATLDLGLVNSIPDLTLLADRPGFPAEEKSIPSSEPISADKIVEKYPELGSMSIPKRARTLMNKIVADQVVGMTIGTLVYGYFMAFALYCVVSMVWIGQRAGHRRWRSGKSTDDVFGAIAICGSFVPLVMLLAPVRWVFGEVPVGVEVMPAYVLYLSSVLLAAPVLAFIERWRNADPKLD
jgi:hypothetical protein